MATKTFSILKNLICHALNKLLNGVLYSFQSKKDNTKKCTCKWIKLTFNFLEENN